jgi:hypothetical protein
MPSDINRLAVPTLAKGLHVVVKPCNLRRSPLFKEIAILAVPLGEQSNERPLFDFIRLASYLTSSYLSGPGFDLICLVFSLLGPPFDLILFVWGLYLI